MILPPKLSLVTEFEVPMLQSDIDMAIPRIKEASENLGRRIPKSISKDKPSCHMAGLLCRNYKILERVNMMHVIGPFERKRCYDKRNLLPCEIGKVKGDADWYVQMVIDHNISHADDWKDLYVFDVNDETWYELNKYDEDKCDWSPNPDTCVAPFIFLPATGVPLLSRKSGVVGSTKLSAGATQVLNTVFNRTLSTLFRFGTLV